MSLLLLFPASAPSGTNYTDAATGTLTLSGTRTEAQAHTSSRTGTLTLTGTRTESQTHSASRTGTLTFSGTRSESQSHTRAATGTLTLSGSKTESWVIGYIDASSGTLRLSGTSTETFVQLTPPAAAVDQGGPMGYGPTIRGMRDIQAWRDRLEDEEIILILTYLAT